MDCDNAANHDEKQVRDCEYFWNLSATEIQSKLDECGEWCGHVACWKYANERGGVTMNRVKGCDYLLIRWLGGLQYIEVLEYLFHAEIEGQKLTIDALRSNNNYLLGHAAQWGLIKLLKFVCETEIGGKKLTIGDIRDNNNRALRVAAETGHLEVVEYLCETEFGGEKLTIHDIRSEKNQALFDAACNGHLNIFSYLFKKQNK